MTTDFRMGTFNVQNLFERAKIFNKQDTQVVAKNLGDLAQLQEELRRTTYDKAKILSLVESLKLFIKVNEQRRKLLGKRNGQKAVVANGRGDWDGYVQMKRARYSETGRKNTAQVMKSVNADVLGLVEVENRLVMKQFDTDLLPSNKDYDYSILVDGNDQRGIDVGLYSRFPIGGIWTHMFEGTATSRTFSRDCLEVEVLLPNGESLWVLVNHFKSKFGGDTPSSKAKRKKQADRVAEILKDDYDLRFDLVCVMGDFNDTPDSAPLQGLLGMSRMHDVLELQFPSAADRWTYRYGSKNNQIDYMLVSDPLRDAFASAAVERRGLFTKGHTTPFSTVTSRVNAASDHAAVFADFAL